MIEIAGRRVALYARHSTVAQDRSVPAQLARCRDVAKQNAAIVVAEYADKAKTGAVLETRPEAKSLLEHAEQGAFEAVLIEDLSRVSRDQADVATIYKVLTFHGVALISVTEGPVSELHIGLKGTMNALALKDLSDKTRRGQFAAVRNGAVPGGRIYGYDVVRRMRPDGSVTTGQRRIDEAEADVVLRIFTEAASGKPIRKIAADLNRDGIPSVHGKHWAANTLVGTRSREAGLLRRPIYKGCIIFGRTRTARHPLTGKRVVRPRPKPEWLIVEAPELAIVAEELFDRAQNAIDRPPPIAKSRPGRKRAEPLRYLTSGRTWCASCGGRVTTAHSGYLICRTWKEHQGCDQRLLFRRDRIIKAILHYFATPDCEAQLRDEVVRQIEHMERHASNAPRTIEAVDGLLCTAVERIAALGRETDETIGFAHLRERIRDSESGIADLRHRLAQVHKAYAAHPKALSAETIARAAAGRLAKASARLRTSSSHDAAEGGLLARALASVHVVYTDPARRVLTVRPDLDGKEVYEIGMSELAVDARRAVTPQIRRTARHRSTRHTEFPNSP